MRHNKVLLCLLLLLFLPLVLLSETIYWEDSFDTNIGWTLEGNWSISSGMMRLYWSPTISPYDLSAVSPLISLPVNVGDLIITQHIDVFSIVNEVAEINIVSGMETTQVWYYEMTNGNWGAATGSDLVIPLLDFAGQDIQIEFRSYGQSTYNINWWDIFNVAITILLDNDMTALDVTGPNQTLPGQENTWTVNVMNSGMNLQEGYTVKLMKHGDQELASILVTEPLASGESASFDFNWTPDLQENTGLYGIVQSTNDEFDDNNISGYSYLRVCEELDLNVLVWDHDNNSTYYDPITGVEKDTETGVESTLDINGIDYTTLTYLPNDLSAYDMIFVALGLYCVG